MIGSLLLAIAVANAGFEEGKKEWSVPANATVVTNEAHSGKNSMKIEVASPRPGCVYVTRLVAAKPGEMLRASCWVKTHGVREAEKAGIGQNGASLIVEWTDKNGKWMQGGEYSGSVWGTNDWKRLEVKRVVAPPGAGFACVYLSLRAAGTAWFDDIEVEKLTASVEKLSPKAGEQNVPNCPLFSWKPQAGWRRSSVLLSRSPDFADGKTRRYDAGGIPEFRLEEPLEPGTWHWKVVSSGMDDEKPSSFTVTMPKEADGLPPQVKTKAARVLAGDQPFEIEVRELTAELPAVSLKFPAGEVFGLCVDGSVKNILKYRFLPPNGGWPKGFSELQVEARDKAGNRESRAFYLLNSPKPENDVVVDHMGYMRENGKRIFPIGIYEVAKKYMDEVREYKFDAVHTYRWEGDQNDVECRKYLDQCWAANHLRAFIGFDRGNWSHKGLVNANYRHVAHRVGSLADHPGMFCWYLFDEPELLGQFVAPELLIAYADLIRALDPYHPVVMSTWNKTMIEYRRSWDTHWTQAYGAPRTTLDRLEQERGYLFDESPITLLINCNDGKQGRLRRQGIEPDPTRFALDTEYMRACAFLSVTRECNGLWWWWFARDTKDYYTAGQNPKAWAGVKQVLKELDELRPVITDEAKPVFDIAKAGKAKVSWWCKQVDGKTTFIAVNTEDGPVTVEIDVPGIGKKSLSLTRYEVKVERN